MSNCPDCGSKMILMISSSFCPNDCDRKSESSGIYATSSDLVYFAVHGTLIDLDRAEFKDGTVKWYRSVQDMIDHMHLEMSSFSNSYVFETTEEIFDVFEKKNDGWMFLVGGQPLGIARNVHVNGSKML